MDGEKMYFSSFSLFGFAAESSHKKRGLWEELQLWYNIIDIWLYYFDYINLSCNLIYGSEVTLGYNRKKLEKKHWADVCFFCRLFSIYIKIRQMRRNCQWCLLCFKSIFCMEGQKDWYNLEYFKDVLHLITRKRW